MLTQLPEYETLREHQRTMADVQMRSLFAADAQRFEHFHLKAAGLTLDYSKNLITADTMGHLLNLANQAGLSEKIAALFAGEPVNSTEHRPALHMALRDNETSSLLVNGRNVMPDIRACWQKMAKFVTDVRDGEWRGSTGQMMKDVVNIGIGGSDLGPSMVTEALEPYHQAGLKIHFVSNVDSASLGNLLGHLDPARTLFIVASKSFATQESLYNAHTAKLWLIDALGQQAVASHFVAVTANAEAAIEFGMQDVGIFPIWDWVGGRFSVWSAVGLAVALAVGLTHFQDFLAGAHAMDVHCRESPLAINMPVILGLLDIWYINFFDTRSHAIVPYAEGLRRFPAYLQQLIMESNGKACSIHEEKLAYHTAPVIWGSAGSNGQHAFHQLLHQGTRLIPVDFILPLSCCHELREHHRHLVANCLSQSQALMLGNVADQATPTYQFIPGNKPSNTILLPKLAPTSLGALLALYEHKTFVQSVLWGINAFDQWGVELGKQLAGKIFDNLLDSHNLTHDSSTAALISIYQQLKAC